MKKSAMVLWVTFFVVIALTSGSAAGEVRISVLENTPNSIVLEYVIGEFSKEKVTAAGQDYYRVTLGLDAPSTDGSKYNLPTIRRSIIIPDDARMGARIVDCQCSEYHLPLAISSMSDMRYRGTVQLPQNQFPQTMPEIIPAGRLVELGTPYILRDFTGVTVTVHPFAYNPDTQILHFYTRLVVEVFPSGENVSRADSPGNQAVNRYFENVYRNHFLNFEIDRYDIPYEKGPLLVICHGDFLDAIQPYIQWKRQKGIPTDVYDVADIGTTPQLIKAFITDRYNENKDLTFVQLVGDYEHIPSMLISRDFCPSPVTSDASYALLEGGDSYPELFIGRFSGATEADIQTQVERTIYYEKQIAEGDWMHRACGLGSAWGDGYGYMGLSDRDLIEMLRLVLVECTYTEMDQLYEEGIPPFDIIPVPVIDFIRSVNEGRGLVLAAGSADCEGTFMIPPGTFDDLFTTDSVFALQNEYMLPFISIAAPYLGDFQIDLTYPEAWMRAVNPVTEVPIGAIAVYASSTDLDYASPQAALYEMVNLLVSDQLRSVGGLAYTGACYAIELYGQRGEKTFQSYHLLGDVSLQLRTASPMALTILHDTVLYTASTSCEVSVEEEIEALCAIFSDGELIGSAYTNEFGKAVIEFDRPLDSLEEVTLTVTAYNAVTYIAGIPVIPGSPFTCGDANGDEIVNVGDVVFIISYVFKGGPAPDPIDSGDANCDGTVNVGDAVYLIAYIFNGGPDPCCP